MALDDRALSLTDASAKGLSSMRGGAPVGSLALSTRPAVAAVASKLGPRDLRAYRLLRFASGLRVLLASDASARDATVAATVGAGQLREPVEGLSHLTEHLVMRAGDLEAVAASFDGNANAYTAFDCTTYVASCFPSRVGRLLAAYGDAVAADGGQGPPRGAALELELLRHRAVGPLSRFGPGTKTTLLPLRRPGARRRRCFRGRVLYRARYVAEDATVAVVAPIPLDLLERAARNLGSPLRDGPPPRPPRKPRDPLPALERGSNVVVASGRDVLSLTWSVPYESLGGATHRRAPCATVSHVLGHGGPGSLQAKLRAMAPTSGSRPGQPALSAGAFLENDDASGFALFHVRVFLQRSAQWEEALTHALGAVAALRLTPLPLWKDAADECAPADLQWRFPRPPTASELANDMRCADFDVLGARRYAAAPRDAALAASRSTPRRRPSPSTPPRRRP
ncbi:M16 peptidase-like protein [Aureococcus anophagefferens]|nr:M16 peptidase-like protein [Aureococcus anophagefferens]